MLKQRYTSSEGRYSLLAFLLDELAFIVLLVFLLKGLHRALNVLLDFLLGCYLGFHSLSSSP